MVSFKQFAMGVVSEEKFLPLQRRIKMAEAEMNSAVIYRQRLKSDSSHWPHFSEGASFALNYNAINPVNKGRKKASVGTNSIKAGFFPDVRL